LIDEGVFKRSQVGDGVLAEAAAQRPDRLASPQAIAEVCRSLLSPFPRHEATMNPWDPMEGESAAAYRAARIYFEMGQSRSLHEVSRRITRQTQGKPTARAKQPDGSKNPNGAVTGYSKRFHWVERARAYDAHLVQSDDQARIDAKAKVALSVEERRQQVAEQGREIAQAFKVKLLQMIAWPLSETTTTTTVSQDGTTITNVTTVSPTNWRIRDAAPLLKVASDLERLVLGMPNRVVIQTPGDVTPPDPLQAEEDNNRIPPDLAAEFLDSAARRALQFEGRDDAQPEG